MYFQCCECLKSSFHVMDLMLLNADALNMVRTLDCMYTACVVSVASH